MGKLNPETIRFDVVNGIMTITLNRPQKKNAIGIQTMRELSEALQWASQNEGVDFVILTGAGDYYSSGADLKPWESDDGVVQPTKEGEMIRIGREFIDTLIDFPKLLIAVVNGPAIGIAVTTLALCDLVFCSSEATFLVPFASFGLSAEGCSSYLFPRIMGFTRANEVLQFGRKFTALEAKQWGLVSEIYKPQEIRSILLPKIHKMRDSQVNAAIKVNKMLVRRWNAKSLHEVNAAEWSELETRLISPEFLEAMMSFTKKKGVTNKL